LGMFASPGELRRSLSPPRLTSLVVGLVRQRRMRPPVKLPHPLRARRRELLVLLGQDPGRALVAARCASRQRLAAAPSAPATARRLHRSFPRTTWSLSCAPASCDRRRHFTGLKRRGEVLGHPPYQLILFVFLTSLTGAAQLILSRQLGVSRRMLATPTSVGTILLGEALGRFAVALFQAVFIVAATALIFGVAWGDPLGATVLVLVFTLVAAGVAMLIGAIANNAEQAGSLGVFAGLGIAAIGGSMVPPEIFPEPMATISWFTPHRWALDGFRELIVGGGVLDILPQLGVLLGLAAVVLALATWRLRAALTR
jgi:ABC-type uncharacterized transport system permease subunit